LIKHDFIRKFEAQVEKEWNGKKLKKEVEAFSLFVATHDSLCVCVCHVRRLAKNTFA